MLYYLSQFESVLSELRLFQYITVRTLCAAATGFVIMLLISPRWIHRLRAVNFSEQKVDERVGVERKGQKLGTPTMGGIIIIIATPASGRASGGFTNPTLRLVRSLLQLEPPRVTLCVWGRDLAAIHSAE